MVPSGLSRPELEPLIVRDLQQRLNDVSAGSARRIADYQESRLRDLVTHAAATAPYYATCLEPFAGSANWKLSDLPFLTRATLRDCWATLVSDTANGTVCDRKVTSGTSGIPVTILQSEAEWYSTLHYDLKRAVSIARFDREEHFASPYVLAITDNPFHAPFATYNPLLDKWCRFEVMDPLDGGSIRRALELIEELEPAVLICRPGGLQLLAEQVCDRGRRLSTPLSIVSCGANLYSDDRRRFTEVLNATICDLYALSECSGVASTCPRGRFHVHWELASVEIIDPATGEPAKPEQPGKIVVTDLSRQAMPIIRYETGDWATGAALECPCGLPGPCLLSVDGRDGCYFRLPQHRLFNPAVFNTPLSWVRGLQQYRLVQTLPAHIRVEYSANGVDAAALQQEMEQIISQALPEPIQISFERKQSLEVPGKKFERYLSVVPAS